MLLYDRTISYKIYVAFLSIKLKVELSKDNN